MEGLSVHISMHIHFVMVYGTLSNLKFIRPLFSSATRKQQWLSYSLSEQQRRPNVRESSGNVGKHYIHEVSFIQALQGFSLKLASLIFRLKTAFNGYFLSPLLLWRTGKVNDGKPKSNKTTQTAKRWESMKDRPSLNWIVSVICCTNTLCQSVQLRGKPPSVVHCVARQICHWSV